MYEHNASGYRLIWPHAVKCYFIWLLTCEEDVTINALADYVFQCFKA